MSLKQEAQEYIRIQIWNLLLIDYFFDKKQKLTKVLIENTIKN